MKRNLFCTALLLACGTGVLPAQSREEFDKPVVKTAMVAMRDGVKLSTDIYLPARGGKQAEGKFPVLVERTPYGRRKGGSVTQVSLSRRGYAVVAQDCRGRFDSEGEFYPFVNEGPDGYDTIEWAAAQPWSNGKVATFGGSYTGMDQYPAAILRPPHLVAMFIQMAAANFYQELAWPGGVPNLRWQTWMLNTAATSQPASRNPRVAETIQAVMRNPMAWYNQPPEKRAEIFRDVPSNLRAFNDLYAHPLFDAYWKQPGFYPAGSYRDMKDVPILFVSGWYDYFLEGTLDAFSNLSGMQKTAKKLIVGPWPHGIGKSECGDATFGPSADEQRPALIGDWFDHWLRGRQFEVVGPEAVKIFRIGGGDGARSANGKMAPGGEWRTVTAWPPPASHAVSYYISGDALRKAPPAEEPPSRFEFDPDHPVPMNGGRTESGKMCIQDQNSAVLKDRQDILTFQSAPLESPVEVTGKVRAKLWISSDAPDTDFTAKLVDVYPNGYAAILVDGQIRTRYREGFQKTAMMEPGKIYAVEIELGSMSNQFGKGHRIRVDISSSNFPKVEPNSNTGEQAFAWTRRVKAHNAVYHDAAHPSHIDLPERD
jgi:putative CocE/NonD family hydrolase